MAVHPEIAAFYNEGWRRRRPSVPPPWSPPTISRAPDRRGRGRRARRTAHRDPLRPSGRAGHSLERESAPPSAPGRDRSRRSRCLVARSRSVTSSGRFRAAGASISSPTSSTTGTTSGAGISQASCRAAMSRPAKLLILEQAAGALRALAGRGPGGDGRPAHAAITGGQGAHRGGVRASPRSRRFTLGAVTGTAAAESLTRPFRSDQCPARGAAPFGLIARSDAQTQRSTSLGSFGPLRQLVEPDGFRAGSG
jgi:hypothetical protein